jgi:hypothetical protein
MTNLKLKLSISETGGISGVFFYMVLKVSFEFFDWAGVSSGYVPHPRAGIPDQQGVRKILQVYAQHQGKCFLYLGHIFFCPGEIDF